MLCAYCNEKAFFILKNGKHCCSEYSAQCPVIKEKTSEGLKRAHADGKMRYDQLDGVRAWNKGKTVYSDSRIRSINSESGVFTVGSTFSTSTLRKIILRENLLSYECKFCGNLGLWKDKKLVLELDHINGDRLDNRLENLRFLCPNCHSQTPTFKAANRGKNSKQNKVDDDTLLETLQTTKSIREALMKVGLCGTGGNYRRAYVLLGSLIIKTENKDAEELQFINPLVNSLPKQSKVVNSKPKLKKPKPLCVVCNKEADSGGKYCSQICSHKGLEKVRWEDYDLIALYKEHGSMLALARYFNNVVSDNAIRKRLLKLGFDPRKRLR